MSGFVKDAQADELLPAVSRYIEHRIAEFDEIPDARKTELEQLSAYIRQCAAEGRPAELTFVCTHNSRRSHLTQLWARIAAVHYRVPAVKTYSGGTEVTAFNPRAVAALQRCGLEITAEDIDSENPRYHVQFQPGGTAEICFSKLFDSPPNPTSQFCAVMTCSHADEACPLVKGCDCRVTLTYEDPKVADGTPMEEDVYDLRTRQISREMLYAMSRVAS